MFKFIILCFLFFCPFFSIFAKPIDFHENYASLVVDAKNGKILHEEYGSKECYPASLTKMMTLYLAFEAVKLGQKNFTDFLRVSINAANQPPSKIGLKSGDKITLIEAINSLIVKSANDSAVVIAEAISGNEENFAKLMTKRAWQLGMKDSFFKNASGLPDIEQKTTAYDMARLAIALQRDFPKYYHLFSKTHFTYKGRKFKSHNHVLMHYPFADGLKTGYTIMSGFNLVTSAKKDGKKLVSIVMGGKTRHQRDYKMVELLDNHLGTKYAALFQSNKNLLNAEKQILLRRAQNKKRNVGTLISHRKQTKISKTILASNPVEKSKKNTTKTTLSKVSKKLKNNKLA